MHTWTIIILYITYVGVSLPVGYGACDMKVSIVTSKDLARCVKCFRNIPKTLASHHQRLMCYYLNSNVIFTSSNITTGSGKRQCIYY